MSTDVTETDNIEVNIVVRRYLSNPSEITFGRILRVTQVDSQKRPLVDLLYPVDDSKAIKSMALKHRIIALYINRRLIEVAFFSEKYLSEFGDDKDVLRIYCSTCIDALLLGGIEEAILKLEKTGEPKSITLLFRLGTALRLGHFNAAHDIAIEMLLYQSLPNELCYDAVLQCAISVDNLGLLLLSLLQLKDKGFRITCGTNNQIKMRQMLKARIVQLLQRRTQCLTSSS